MALSRVSFNTILSFLALTCLSFSLAAQKSDIDTSGYIPLHFEAALEYNLMIAASKGYDTEVERMILKGAEVDAETEEGATALIIAVAEIKPATVNVLLRYNANPNKITSSNETPLLIILRKLAALEAKGLNVLTEAKETDCLTIAESLIRYGADIDFQDPHGATALHYAAAYGSFRFADLLIYYMAEKDKKALDGTTPLMAAIWAGNANVADLLIQNGANMEARDNGGFTPFLIAAQNGDTLLLDYLIKNGVDIYEQEKHGWDALSLSIKYNHREAAEMLIRAGDKWGDHGRNALNYNNIAVKYGRKELSEILQKNNISGKYSIKINQVEPGLSAKFNLHDIYTGFNFTFREPGLNLGFITGVDTKLWYTKVITEESPGIYYQYLHKNTIAYAGIFKDLPLTDKPLRGNFILSGSLSAGYTFGGDFRGTSMEPANKMRIIPAVTIKWVFRNFRIFAGFEYTNPGFEKTWPAWCRAGLSYNFDFELSKIPVKTIRWF